MLVACNPESKLFLSKHLGDRKTEDWETLFKDMAQRFDEAHPLPLIISGGDDAIKEAVEQVFSHEEEPIYKGRGRPPSKHVRRMREDLKYAQVIKHKDAKGKLTRVETKIIYGSTDEINGILHSSLCSRNINTAFIERQNLSVRNYARRFTRKSLCFSKAQEYLNLCLNILQAWFNFTKPHYSLRVPSDKPGRKYDQRTPAMAQGITDHIWTWEEILRWRSRPST